MISARGTNQYKRDGYVIQPKCVSTKQKIMQGRGPSNINLVIFFVPLKFAGFHNQFLIITTLIQSLPRLLVGGQQSGGAYHLHGKTGNYGWKLNDSRHSVWNVL